jgi:CubicO group peptidase (beta-lactamase class C family)
LICAAPAWAGAAPALPQGEKLKKIIAEFADYAEKAQQEWQVPGMAVAVVAEGQTVMAKGFGVREINQPGPVDENTLFQIGSTSKAFTAAILAKLVDQKKLNWTDKVIDHLPWFAMYDPWVTREFMVTDLMAQRSGLAPYSGDAQAMIGYDRGHIMRALRHLKPVTSFRSQYAYHNGLYLVAGALGEKFTGKTWEENVAQELFKPFGMAQSSTGLAAYKKAPNASALHIKPEKQVTALSKDWPLHNWVYEYGPAGGINSNLKDMVKWLKFQMGDGKAGGRQVISKENLEYMHLPQTITGGSNFAERHYYGLGWVYSSLSPLPMIWHNGGTTGSKTMVAFAPGAKWGIVVLSNLITSLPEALAHKFYDLYFGNPAKDYSAENLAAEKKAMEAQKAPAVAGQAPLALDNYAGVFRNAVYGDFTVRPIEKALEVSMGPWQAKMQLLPLNRDAFMMKWPGVISSGQLEVAEFAIGPDGKAWSMRLTWDGGQEFVRVPPKAGE